MVCLSDSDSVLFVTVQDALDQTNERTDCLSLTPDKTVESVISEVTQDLNYERNNVQLVFKAYGMNTVEIPLDPTKYNTMRDTGINFDLVAKAVIVVTPRLPSHYKNVYSGFFNESSAAAAPEPTSQPPPPAPAPPMPPPPSSLTNAVAVPALCQERVSSINVYYKYKRWEGSSPKTSDAFDAPFNYVGLVNQAMTCYLNSLLQALYMTPEFRNALYNWEFDGNVPSKSIPFQLQKLFLNLQTSTKSAVETTDLTHSFGWNMQHAWEQHDIQELCRVMFDALEQKFKDTQQANLINDLYEGKMLDYVKCLECSTEKSREDTFLDIPLPVRPFGSSVAYNSIEEALRAFVQPETLNDNNQYHCEKCDKKCDAHKGLKFIKFPYLLTLHLKRFDFDYSTMNRIKLNDKVVFPEKLNLNLFVPAASPMSEDAVDEREMIVKCDDCSTTDSGSALDDDGCQGTDVSLTANGPDDSSQDDDEGIDVSSGNNQHENEKNRLQEPKGPYIYELFSIMIHSGSASGGHYYAYIKDFSKNQWFCFNDQMVTRVTEDDIHKTYGGGPHRGYYSGAYTSSTNAYMLMYRQIDAERNREALTVDEFPPHIKRLLEDMRKKEASDRLKKEQESDMYDVRVTCLHPIQNQLIDKKMYVYSELTIGELKSEAHVRFKLKDIVRLDDCRLVAYNRGMETVKCSLDGDDVKFADVDSKYNEFLLEIKEPSATFEEYKLGGVIMKVYHINMETEEVDGPRKIWVNAGDTVQQLKQRLTAMFGLSTVHVVQEAYNNDPRYVADDGPLNFDPRLKGHKLYVADSLDPDPVANQSFPASKLASVIDRFVHLIMLEISLPETDAATLDQLSIPSLDVNQNLDRIDVGDRGASNSSSLRVSPQPGSGNCELFGDQSNSEDSSLSDSDRTLVGDAPGDNLGLLSSNSNSPTDQHMASPTEQNDEVYPDMAFMHHRKEEMFWEDEDLSSCTEKVCSANYYFKAHFPDKHDSKSVQILVDKRTSLSKLKMNLEPIVGVPKEYFKIYRQYPNQDVSEWATLTETLNSLKDGDRLTVKLGRVLKENEYAGKIYYLQPNHVEPVTFWFEWIVAKEQTVASVKKEILQMAKTQYMVDIPFNRCRLRKKYLKEASRILLDDERFNDSVMISSNFELYVQKIDGAEKRNSRQLALFARRWHPDRLALSPFEEIVIDNKTLDDLKRTISEASGIPLEFVEVTFIKGSFLCDMNVLDVHTKLDWNPDSKCFLLLYDDGSTVYYRDSRDTLKELTTEERKELNHSENKRLGRISRKTYSPRRECGLKIYVDTSPKKEDDVFLD